MSKGTDRPFLSKVGLARVTQFIGRAPFFGSALRWWANRFVEGSVVRIQQGHAAGYSWKRHHRYVNGYWIGQYELPIQEAIVRELRPSQIFFDVGANAGFFMLVAARVVGATGKCVAFDPSPENYASLRAQMELNRLIGCEAVMEAVAENEGSAKFSFPAGGSPKGHLGAARTGEKEIEVKVTTLDAAARKYGYPSLIKMDIEGGEVLALRGAAELLRVGRPTWLIELHGNRCAAEVRIILAASNYEFFDLQGTPLPLEKPLPHHVVVRPTGRSIHQ